MNQCASLNKKLIDDYLSSLKQNADIPTLRSMQVEQTNLHRIISDVSNKLDGLSSQNRNLQKQIEDVCFQSTSLQNQITDTSESISQTTAPTSESPKTAALSIVDELADRERRKIISLFITFQSLLTILRTNHFLLSCVSLSLTLLLK